MQDCCLLNPLQSNCTSSPHSPPPPAYKSKMNYSAVGWLLRLICITTV